MCLLMFCLMVNLDLLVQNMRKKIEQKHNERITVRVILRIQIDQFIETLGVFVYIASIGSIKIKSN